MRINHSRVKLKQPTCSRVLRKCTRHRWTFLSAVMTNVSWKRYLITPLSASKKHLLWWLVILVYYRSYDRSDCIFNWTPCFMTWTSIDPRKREPWANYKLTCASIRSFLQCSKLNVMPNDEINLDCVYGYVKGKRILLFFSRGMSNDTKSARTSCTSRSAAVVFLPK